MEIKVGEYVRTKAGLIAKVVYKIKETSFISKSGRKCTSPERYYLENIKKYSISKPYIVSHSFNIIDLIQEGDFVNGDKIVPIDYTEDENGNYIDVLGIMEIDDDYAYPIELRVLNIKSIVTKEKFSSLEYKI